MTFSAAISAKFSTPSIALFKKFKPRRKTSALAALAVVAAMSSPAGAASVKPGAYDGNWNVTFTTRAGNCSSNSAPFSVSGTRVSSAGGGKVTGGISAGGAVSVNISVGASHASGTGRLGGSTGTGRWTGVISGDKCSGTWQATKA